MRINELQLISFGKFSDYTIRIKDGLNVIYGKNEAGKSTVLLFIKLMFYGIPAGRARSTKSGEVNDRLRIIPWNGGKASGRIKLTVGSRRIEIYREFGKRASGDVVRVTDSDTGEDYFGSAVSGEEVGERLLGMSRGMFERTLWIGQDDVCMRGKNDEITARLMNFLDSGTASDISVSDALKQLEKKELSIKARTKRNAKGEIDLLCEERDRLSARLSGIRAEENKRRQDREALTKLEERSKNLGAEIEHLSSLRMSELAKEKIKRVDRLDSCLKREMQIANTRMFQVFKHKAADETVDKMAEDYSKIGELEVLAYEQNEKLGENQRILEKRRETSVKNRILAGIPAVLALIAAILCFVLDMSAVLCFGLVGTAIVFAVLCGVIVFTASRNLNILADQVSEINAQLGRTRSEISETEQRLNQTLKEFECKSYTDFKEKYGIYLENKAKIKVCRDIYTEALGGDDYAELKKEADELKKLVIQDESITNADCDKKLKALEAEKNKALSEIAALKHRISICDEMVLPADIKSEISEIDKRLAEKERELKSVQLAEECLSRAYAKIKSDFTPYLNRETLSLLSEMTDGQHENIKVADDFSVNLNKAGDSGDSKQAEFFSMGTYNQIYFALRLAIMRLTVDRDNRILYLDDMLMTYDDERSRRTIDMLKKLCGTDNIQILLFTCHGRDLDCAADYSEAITAITI